jgi:hypothetical protein
MESTETKIIKKRQINPDRIVLEGKSLEFVRRVADQIEQSFGGIIKLTNKEIANFLLQSRSDLLSAAELKAVKDKYFDDVRAAQWAVQKLKVAKDGGQSLTLADVFGQLQTPIVKEKRRRCGNKEKGASTKSKEVQGIIEIEK